MSEDNKDPSQTAANILKVIAEREELAYESGVKDTLAKVLPQFKQMQVLIERNIVNIEATIAMDRLFNKADEDANSEESVEK